MAAETAFRILDLTEVRHGDVVLVHGAAGSVGAMTVQLAVARGAIVVGTAHPRHQDFVTALGARWVDYADGWAGRVRSAVGPVDAVVHTAGADVLALSIELTGDPFRVVSIVDRTATALGARYTGGNDRGQPRFALTSAADLYAAGAVTVAIAESLPLDRAATAHEHLQSLREPGKIVLIP